MIRRKFIIVMCLSMAIAVLPWGVGLVCAQQEAAGEKIDAARADSLRQHAERVQERRNSRAAYEKWKYSKARDKAARARGARTNAAPVKDENGGAQ